MGRSSDEVTPKGIQSGISADLVIRAMIGLLDARRSKKIKRITFLKVWGRLRRLLALTPEYARWRWNVKTRAGGACERCAEPGNHAHHKEPVARNPAKALDLSNGEYLCWRCHKAEHRKPRARSGTPATRKGSSPVLPRDALSILARTTQPSPRR